MRINGTKSFFLIVTLAVAPVLAACGGGGSDHSGQHGDHAAPSGKPSGEDDMAGMYMGSESETPADKVAGANLRTSQFGLLDTRPPGLDKVAGTAMMATHPGGTTVTVKLTGLKAEEKYVAHLHALPCAQDDGGEHFRFDPKGSEMPPNEVHLAFAGKPDGQGYMTANNDRPADGAKSIVVHPKEATDNRIACADF